MMRWHLITPEYPPNVGGVSDYTCQLAERLAAEGDEVHVWCSGRSGASPDNGPSVHREFGGFTPADLRHAGQALDRFPAPRHILVQWVPHGFGYRSMNLPFCWWLWRRAERGDFVELMVHEPFLTFDWASPLQNIAALAHRCMTILLLRAATRVWVSIPHWERMLRGYALGRQIAFQWLPIFSNIPVADDPARTQAIKRQYADGDRLLIGHFGTFGPGITTLLGPILTALGGDSIPQTILLMGDGSHQYRQSLMERESRLGAVIQATGRLSACELSHHLSACDLLIQPYPDGVSSRRTSFMAGLANAKPTVTTTGWLTEPLWFDSGAVALAAAGDTDAFVKQVRRLRDEHAERLRAGSAAARLYKERFDISHTISALRMAQIGEETPCAF